MPDPSTTNPSSDAAENDASTAAEEREEVLTLDEEVDALIDRVEQAAAEVERKASEGEPSEDWAKIDPAAEQAPPPADAKEVDEGVSAPAPSTQEPADFEAMDDLEMALAEAEEVAEEEASELAKVKSVDYENQPPETAETTEREEEESDLALSIDEMIADADAAGETDVAASAPEQTADAQPVEECADRGDGIDIDAVSAVAEAETKQAEWLADIDEADFECVDTVLDAREAHQADRAESGAAEREAAAETEAGASGEQKDDVDLEGAFESPVELIESEATAGQAGEAERDVEPAGGLETQEQLTAGGAETAAGETQASPAATAKETAAGETPTPPAEPGETPTPPSAPPSAHSPVAPAPAAASETPAPPHPATPAPAPAWRRLTVAARELALTAGKRLGPIARSTAMRLSVCWSALKPHLLSLLHLLNSPYRKLSPDMREFVGWAAVVTAFAALTVWIILVVS